MSGGEEVPTGGDVITALDGDPVSTAEELRARIDAKQPGDELEVTYVRGRRHAHGDGDARRPAERLERAAGHGEAAPRLPLGAWLQPGTAFVPRTVPRTPVPA